MMRVGDIAQGMRPTNVDHTPEMYLPARRNERLDPAELTDDELRRGLCAKSCGDVAVCKTCAGGCRWGVELARRCCP